MNQCAGYCRNGQPCQRLLNGKDYCKSHNWQQGDDDDNIVPVNIDDIMDQQRCDEDKLRDFYIGVLVTNTDLTREVYELWDTPSLAAAGNQFIGVPDIDITSVYQ